MSTLKKEWQWCLQQSCRKKRNKNWTSVCEASDWHLTNVPVRLLFALQCTSEGRGKKTLVEASCPWVESHCGQPAPQVPCHPLLSWTVPPGWSLCCESSSYVCFGVFFIEFFSFVCTAARLPCRRGLEPSPILLLCISSELINSLGLYDWGDCLGALNPIQLIKS